MQPANMIAKVVIVMVALSAVTGCITGRSGFEKPNVFQAKLDFVPISRNDYLVNWPGPPRRRLTNSDLYFFTPIIELEGPAPAMFSRWYDIMADGPDDFIGSFKVTFNQGSTRPDKIEYPVVLPESDAEAPAGEGDEVGRFWLGCTMRGYLRGNAGNLGHRQLHLYIARSQMVVPADGVTLGGMGRSSSHLTWCY
jgi:hypothetical protein